MYLNSVSIILNLFSIYSEHIYTKVYLCINLVVNETKNRITNNRYPQILTEYRMMKPCSNVKKKTQWQRQNKQATF